MTARAHHRNRPKLRRYSKGFWRGLVIERLEDTGDWIADQHNGRTTGQVNRPLSNGPRPDMPLVVPTPDLTEIRQYPSEFARLGYSITDGEVTWEPSSDEWKFSEYRFLLACYEHGAPLKLILRAIRLHMLTGADASSWEVRAHRAVKPTQQLERAIALTNSHLVDGALTAGFSPDLVTLPEYCEVEDCTAITYDQGETFHIVGSCLAKVTKSPNRERCESRPPPNPRLVPCRPNGPSTATATRSERVCVSVSGRGNESHARQTSTGGSC